MEPRTFPSELCSTESFIPGMVDEEAQPSVPHGVHLAFVAHESQGLAASISANLARLARRHARERLARIAVEAAAWGQANQR
jgi:hypothetical protein